MTTLDELTINDRVWIDPDAPSPHAGMPARVWGFANDGRVTLFVPIIGEPNVKQGHRIVRIEPEHLIKAPTELPPPMDALDHFGELQWMQGNRAAWRRLLQVAYHELGAMGADEKELRPAWTVGELEDVRAQLRSLAREIEEAVPNLECNDWSNELHLGDVIDKHIGHAVRSLLDELGEE